MPILEVAEYDPSAGLRLVWSSGHEIRAATDPDGSVHILANAAGMRSMAAIFLALADPALADGYHLHLDRSNGLGEESSAVIVERHG